MISALKNGAGMRAGVDHTDYQHQVTIEDAVLQSLVGDFD